MTTRSAKREDVEQMALLADAKRRDYEPHAPVFHRPASDALDIHRPWLARLADDDAVGTFVHENRGGDVDGFLVISVHPPPPVYAPGGQSSLIDDFCVSGSDGWREAGPALLHVATEWARSQGAVQVIVVCGPHDQAKRRDASRRRTLRSLGVVHSAPAGVRVIGR
jgi:GNAT superfamily N-acetyltransferase